MTPAAMPSLLAVAVSLALAAGTHAPARTAPAAKFPRSAIAFDFESAADTNWTWPAQWRRGGNRPTGVIRLDTPGHRGDHAVRLSMPDSAGSLAIVRDVPDSLRAGAVAVRLSGWLRTEGAGRAGLFVRAIGRLVPPATDDMSGRGPRGTTEWTRYEVLLPLAPEIERVSFGAHVAGGGTLWADDLRLELLRPGEGPQPSAAARAYFEAAIDSICRRTVLTSELRWGLLKSGARTQMLGATRVSQTHDALRYAIRRLDARAELSTAAEAAARRAAPADPVTPNIERIDDAYGVLVISACMTRSLAGKAAYADALRAALERAAPGIRGWIVDLRGVGSSELEPALSGLAPLLGDGLVGGWMRPNGIRAWWTVDHGRFEEHRARSVPGRRPVARATDSLPVAVITGGGTKFEGEALALAFRGRPNTRFFGAATGGNALAREIIRFSDGTELRFETARFVDRAGRQADGPLQPDESLAVSPMADRGDSATVAALRWLRERSPGVR